MADPFGLHPADRRARRWSAALPDARCSGQCRGKPSCSSWLVWGVALSLLAGCERSSRPAIIEGSSMAPRLYGAHLRLVCGDCGCEACFRIDLQLVNLLCPNCGAPHSAAELRKRPPPPLEIEALTGRPRRWEVVAFVAPGRGGSGPRLTVKRVAGLPGEELTIAAGDLWVAGERLVKIWEEQVAVRIQLRDLDYLPRGERGQRVAPWSAAPGPTRWKMTEQGLELNPIETDVIPLRLEYQHWAGYHSGRARFEPVPIYDAQPFDPREARSLEPVYDLLLSGEVATPEAGFTVGFQQFAQPLSCEFSPSTRQLRIRGAFPEGLQEFAYAPPSTAYRFGISTFDRHLTVAINDRQLLQIPIAAPPGDAQQLARPLFLEAAGGTVRLQHLQLYRDIHYLASSRPAAAIGSGATFRLAVDEFLLLGDNPTDSVDSRDWPSPGLRYSQMVGRVRDTEPSGD